MRSASHQLDYALERKLGPGSLTYRRKDFYDINFQGAKARGVDREICLTVGWFSAGRAVRPSVGSL